MTALARLFGSLANTLLDLGLPRIRGWLRERVGPAADVAQVSSEGSFIHLDGVRLPIGERGELVLERATALITPARGRGVGLPEIRLHAFRGVLRFTSPVGDGQGGAGDELRADVVFAASTTVDDAAWVSGELTIVRATWSARIAREGTPLHEPMEGRARLVVTSTSWSLDEGSLASANAIVRFAGRGATGAADADDAPSATGGALDRAELVLDGARVGPFVDAVQAMLGRALHVPLGVPLDARLSGELAWDARGGGTCTLHMIGEGLDARLSGTVGGDGRSLSAHLEGELAPMVPLRRALVAAALLPRDEDRLTLVLDARGDTSHPDVRATLRGVELGFRFGRPRFQPALLARGVEVDLSISADVAHVEGSARLGHGGTLHLTGDLPLRVREGRRLTARLTELEPSWVTSVLAALAPAAAGVTIPPDARIAADLAVVLAKPLAISGEVEVTTPRSRVALRPLHVGAAFHDTRLVGSLAFADALAVGLFPSDLRPEASGEAALDLAITGTLDSPVLAGTLSSPLVRLVLASRPDVPAFPLASVTTALTLDRSSLRYASGRFHAYDGTFFAEGTVPFAPAPAPAPALLVLQCRDAGPSLVEALAALAVGRVRLRVEREPGPRPPDELWLPRSSRVSGELRLAPDVSIAAELSLETAASTSLLASFVLSSARQLDGSVVEGTLAVADVLTCGALDSAVRPLPDGAAHIEARLRGPLDDCIFAGFVTIPKLRLALHEGGVPSATAPSFVVTDVTTLFRVDAAKLLWHRLEASMYGGSITSAGLLGHGGAFLGLQSTCTARDISVAHLPVDATGNVVGDFARGRLALEVRFDRLGPPAAPVHGDGQARLDDGAFPVLERARPALGRYGISPPAEQAVGPATLLIGLGELGWSFHHMRGAVAGCEAAGDVRVGFDGSVDGALVVTLGQELLASSAVLVVPSLLAERLTVPVRIDGPLGRPRVHADLGACLGRFVTDNRVTALFSEAASDVVSLFTGREPPVPPPSPPAPDNVQVARTEDVLMRELVASGAEWDAIEERLEDHRRGGVRQRIG